MTRLIFAVIILFVCTVTGMFKSYKIKSRLKNLVSIKNALTVFKSNISFNGYNMEKALYQTGINSDINSIFIDASSKVKAMGASRALRYAIDENYARLHLNNDDAHTLSLLCTRLGMINEKEQTENIDYVSNMLDVNISSARYDVEKYCRLYSSGGLLTGAFFCLMLV